MLLLIRAIARTNSVNYIDGPDSEAEEIILSERLDTPLIENLSDDLAATTLTISEINNTGITFTYTDASKGSESGYYDIAIAVYDEEANVYTVTVNAYEDLEEVYTFKVTELQGDIEDMAYNVGEKLEYEITVTVVADEKDHSILNVVALPNTAVDFVNRQYFKAGLYKIDEDTSETLKGAVIRLVRVDDGKIIDEWTTDGTVHLINLIEIGTGTFRFVELKTPDGYE